MILNARVSNRDLLPPPYLGRLTFRGTIPPSGTVIVEPKLWVTRPGTYGLGGWTLETEISIPSLENEGSGRIQRYLQEPSTQQEGFCVVVCNSRTLE